MWSIEKKSVDLAKLVVSLKFISRVGREIPETINRVGKPGLSNPPKFILSLLSVEMTALIHPLSMGRADFICLHQICGRTNDL